MRVNIWANFFSFTWNLIIQKSVSTQLKNVFLNIDQSYKKNTILLADFAFNGSRIPL